jgi:hypothetical protein
MKKVCSFLLMISFFLLPALAQNDIRDIKGPLNYPVFFSLRRLLFWLLIAALLLAFYILAKKYFNRKSVPEKEITPPPHLIAYAALENLKKRDLPAAGKIKQYYEELSNIVRYYLEGRFSIRAPEMTTEEFILFIRESDSLNEAQKKTLKEFLNHCDLVKFARYVPGAKGIEESFQSAKQLIDQTKEP